MGRADTIVIDTRRLLLVALSVHTFITFLCLCSFASPWSGVLKSKMTKPITTETTAFSFPLVDKSSDADAWTQAGFPSTGYSVSNYVFGKTFELNSTPNDPGSIKFSNAPGATFSFVMLLFSLLGGIPTIAIAFKGTYNIVKWCTLALWVMGLLCFTYFAPNKFSYQISPDNATGGDIVLTARMYWGYAFVLISVLTVLPAAMYSAFSLDDANFLSSLTGSLASQAAPQAGVSPQMSNVVVTPPAEGYDKEPTTAYVAPTPNA